MKSASLSLIWDTVAAWHQRRVVSVCQKHTQMLDTLLCIYTNFVKYTNLFTNLSSWDAYLSYK